MLLSSSGADINNAVSRVFIFISLFCAGFTLRPFIACIYSFSTFFSVSYNMSAMQIAALTSIPLFCMGIFAILGRYLEKYFNRERIIFSSIALIACGFLLRSMSDSIDVIFLATIIGGIGIGIGGALVGGLVKDCLPEHVVNGMGVYSLGIGLGAVTGSQVALSSWSINQSILCLIVIGCALVFGAVLCFGRKIEPNLSGSNSIKITLNMALSLIIIIFGLQSLINYTLLLWITSYYQNLEYFHIENINKIAAILLIMQLISSYLISQVLNQVKNKLIPLGILAGVLNLSIILLFFFPISMFWVILIGLGVSTGAIFPLSMSLPIIFSNNTNQAGSWFATMLFGGYLVSAVGPLLFGLVLTLSSSYYLAISVLFTLSLALIIAIYTLNNFLKDSYVN